MASEDNRSATKSAIAKTGAMLLNGQKCASASKSAVACRLRSAATMPYLRTSAKFLVFSDGHKPVSLLTGGLLVRIQPEEPILSITYER